MLLHITLSTASVYFLKMKSNFSILGKWNVINAEVILVDSYLIVVEQGYEADKPKTWFEPTIMIYMHA